MAVHTVELSDAVADDRAWLERLEPPDATFTPANVGMPSPHPQRQHQLPSHNRPDKYLHIRTANKIQGDCTQNGAGCS